MRIALIVYVKKYDDAAVVDLECTANDASDLKAFVKGELPKEQRFEVEWLDDPTARKVYVALRNVKKKLLEAEEKAKKEGRKERNLFLFFFAGHGFARRDGSQYLLCADAIDVDATSALIGGIEPVVLQEFSEGLENTDVVFWIDACRGQVLREKGDENYDLGKFRDVCGKKPNNASSARLTINMCDHGQRAADDGLTMRLALGLMRESLESGKGILLDSTFTETLRELLQKKGRRQTPVANGRPIWLAPGVKVSDKEKLERIQKALEEANGKIDELEQKNSSNRVDYERALKMLEEANRKIADLERKTSTSQEEGVRISPTEQKNSIDLGVKSSAFHTSSASAPIAKKDLTSATGEKPSVWRKFANFLSTPSTANQEPSQRASSSSVFDSSRIGDHAGERREIRIKGVSYGFCWIPSGTFTRSNGSTVRLTRGFWALETPVTQGLWKSVKGSNPSWFCSTGGGSDEVAGLDTTDFPVEKVSWNDCQEFIKKLNAFGVASCGKFRLPTEAEWEYACRAGTNTPYWWGDTLNGDRANCNGNYPFGTEQKGKYLGRTCAVKSYAPNPWGLYDVHGNVWEWCLDGYGAYPSGEVVDPIGTENAPVIRGGSWSNYALDCRSALRNRNAPANRYDSVGFRLILE